MSFALISSATFGRTTPSPYLLAPKPQSLKPR